MVAGDGPDGFSPAGGEIAAMGDSDLRTSGAMADSEEAFAGASEAGFRATHPLPIQIIAKHNSQ